MTKTEFEEWKENNRDDFPALMNLADEERRNGIFENIISSDEVDDFVCDRFESGGWQGVACCISDIIDYMNEDYYEIDGYGNLKPCDSWDYYADLLEDEMEFDIEDDE